ncbi:MAG: protein kinase [Thermodesulfobacteriota bacterium]
MTHSEGLPPKDSWVMEERYVMLRPLREEPWGRVWLAQDRLLEEEVGIKFLPREDPLFDAAKEILIQEAILARRLRHSQILGVGHFGETETGCYLVQEPFLGESLLDHLVRLERFGLLQALQLLTQVGRALAFAHEQRVVHQDLNPLHILLDGEELRLANFACRPLDDNQISHLELKAYTPPEVLRGEPVSQDGNVFSLGVLGFRLLAGSLPYPLTFDEPFPYRLESLPVDLEEVPSPLQNLLLQCLAPEPEDRLPDAGAFLAALEERRDLGQEAPSRRWFDWPPKKVQPRRDLAGQAAELYERLWKQGRLRVGKLWERRKALGAQWRPLSPRLWWGLGLAVLAFILIFFGASLLRRATTPAKPKLEEGALKLPPSEGPPLVSRGAAPPLSGAPPPAETPALGAPKTPARAERYLVLVASYTRMEDARTLTRRLRSQKFPVRIVKTSPGGKTMYQVRVGPLPDRQEAEGVAYHLKTREGLSPKIVTVTARPAPAKPARRGR